MERSGRLKQHVAFQNLLRDVDRLGGRAVNVDELSQVLSRRLRGAGSAPNDYPKLWLGSLLALIAHASGENVDKGTKARVPLLTVRVELWLRELRRAARTVQQMACPLHASATPPAHRS